jgi:exodeoxyribonuclease-3
LQLTITTWNINSVRLRIPLLRRYLESHRPDILCLQETKCRDAEFPSRDVRELGFDHVAISGQKGYHGVAVLSRLPLTLADKGRFCREGHARHMAVTLAEGAGPAAGLTVHNLYVPAGGDDPDPVENDKFQHKLNFLVNMMSGPDRLKAERAVLVGDLNIAPLEHDVWSHRQMVKIVSHTPVEVDLFTRVREAGPWLDAMRLRVPESEKLYTWWSYRAADWAASDRGRRLDHVWLSPDLGPALADIAVCRDARGWDRPSDHVPVTVTLDL